MRWLRQAFLAIAILILIVVSENIAVLSQSNSDVLPALKIHPLPESLARWNSHSGIGDYFDRVESTPLGYLIWSQFPIKVYLERPSNTENITASDRRWQEWRSTVRKGLAEWNNYLPLVETQQQETADIIIVRSIAEREVKLNPDTGLYDIPRAIAAQTTYDFYLQEQPNILAHRMFIKINPAAVGNSLLATVRHELGHALGIWGHSTLETDVLYYSQVRDPLPISPRDINTLKKVYQQPTKLGWKIGERGKDKGERIKDT